MDNMTRDEVADIVKSIISEETDIEKENIQEHMSLIHDLGFDSLDGVELVMKIENRFSIHIKDEQEDKMMTVGITIDVIYAIVNGED